MKRNEEKQPEFILLRMKTSSSCRRGPHPSALRAATFPKGEGLFTLIDQYFIDERTNRFKIIFYIAVSKTYDFQSQFVQIACPGMIVKKCIMISVLHAVDFNDQLCLTAIEIDNISAKLFLSAELKRMVSEKLIP